MPLSNLVRKRLAATITSAGQNGASITLYTVPAGRSAILKEVTAGRYNAGDLVLTLSVNNVNLLTSKLIKSGQQLHLPLSMKLNAGDVVRIIVTGDGASVALHGLEWDGTGVVDPLADLFRTNAVPSAAGVNVHVVPAGRRLVIRNVLLTNLTASVVNQARLYTVGEGFHLAWTPIPANDAVVVHLDQALQPGETIQAYADVSNAAQFWLQGFYEDV